MCDGEKPLTTLVVLLSEMALADVTAEASEVLGDIELLTGADVMICGVGSLVCC